MMPSFLNAFQASVLILSVVFTMACGSRGEPMESPHENLQVEQGRIDSSGSSHSDSVVIKVNRRAIAEYGLTTSQVMEAIHQVLYGWGVPVDSLVLREYGFTNRDGMSVWVSLGELVYIED